ncbi:class I SAM-dependent methyltransferase [Mycobacterium hodleri]|uniref:class I SAM-dependent methyltransferase n=1 Tax=Mycolicibacterium hodleri TaxID=49897 RepID=UPI0021F3A3AA|nr:class I SAM-dependent methyltransferase [Mycolicibacterium hodleri]MCV7133889.1 class I SAM-dependent methyltransferase [Mycolicibacterium hodleri]
MTEPPGSSGDGLFAGTAWHYARYRPGYPEAFFDDLVSRFRLDGTGRLLDLGCGTGQLTIPLARYVAEAVGVDPEPEMLAEAARQARDDDVANVVWAQGSSAELPGGLGRFTLVTMGRSFHWMDRDRVLTALDDMVEADGGVVMANDSCLVRPVTTWQRAVDALQGRFLPPTALDAGAAMADLRDSHEAVLARSPFPRVHRVVHEFTRSWTVDRTIGYLYSTSLPLRRLLGNRRAAFEREVAAAMLEIEPSGRFTEPVTLEVLTATRG